MPRMVYGSMVGSPCMSKKGAMAGKRCIHKLKRLESKTSQIITVLLQMIAIKEDYRYSIA